MAQGLQAGDSAKVTEDFGRMERKQEDGRIFYSPDDAEIVQWSVVIGAVGMSDAGNHEIVSEWFRILVAAGFGL